VPVYTLDRFTGFRIQRSSALNPGTLVALENWELQQDGSLRSRQGSQRIFFNAIGTRVHSSYFKRTQSFRYFGVDGNIKRGTTTTIKTGLTGDRLQFAEMPTSLAEFDTWTFFANGQVACQIKDNGVASTLNWGIDGPTTAPTAAVGTGTPNTLAIHSMDSGWTVPTGDAVTVAFDATINYVSGTSTKVTCPPSSTGRIQVTGLALNLTSYGATVSEDRDFIRVALRVDNRQNLHHVEVLLDVSSGADFKSDYFHYRISASQFNSDQTFQVFKIPKTSFERVKPPATGSRGWATVTGAQFTVAANARGQAIVWIDDFRLEADTHLNGKYKYKITYKNPDTGHRSNSMDLATLLSSQGQTERVSNEVSPRYQSVELSSIPTSPANGASGSSNGTIHREIWRTFGIGGGKYFKILNTATPGAATITDNVTTTYTDTTPDYNLGQQLVETNDIPPPGKGVGGPWYNRLWIWGMNNTTANSGEEEGPHVLRYSKALFPEAWPQLNYVVVSSISDPIQTCAFWNGTIYVFTQTKIYRVIGANVTSEGSSASYVAQATDASIGTHAPYSVSVSPYGIFYLAIDGVYLFDGTRSVNITDTEVEPIFKGQDFAIDNVTHVPLNNKTLGAEQVEHVGEYWGGQYHLAYADRSGVQHVLAYRVDRNIWRQEKYPFTILRLTSEVDNLIAGCNNGYAELLHGLAALPIPPFGEAPLLDDVSDTGTGGVGVPLTLQTKSFDAELKDAGVEADLKDCFIDIDTGGQSVVVKAVFDGGLYTTLGTISTAARDKVFLPINSGIGTIAFTAGIRLEATQTVARVHLYSIGFQYLVEPKRIVDFSTDYDYLGWPGEKILQELQCEANTFGNDVTVTVETDGINLAQTFTLNTTARKAKVFSFALREPRATIIRLKFNSISDTEWKLYSYFVQKLDEPLTVSRVATEKTSDNWDGEKLYKDLAIEIDPLGTAVTAEVFIDDASIGTFTTEAGNKRTIYYFSLAGSGNLERRGRVSYIELSSTALFRFYRHWIEVEREPVRNTFWKTPISDDGWPSEKRFRTLALDINTFGASVTVTPYVDGVAVTGLVSNVFTTTLRQQVHVSIPDTRGRNSSITLSSASTVQFAYYGHSFDFEREPLTSTRYFTQWELAGFEGEKALRQLYLEIDTQAVDATVSILADGTTVQTFTANASGRQLLVFSFPATTPEGEPEGRLVAIDISASGTVRFRYYRHSFEYVRRPPKITVYNSTSLRLFPNRFGYLRRAYLEVKNAGTLNGQVYVDGVLSHSFTVTPQATPKVVPVSLPTGLRGSIFALSLAAASGTFQLWPGSYVQWRQVGEDTYNQWPLLEEGQQDGTQIGTQAGLQGGTHLGPEGDQSRSPLTASGNGIVPAKIN
jgi:hypothetical protein